MWDSCFLGRREKVWRKRLLKTKKETKKEEEKVVTPFPKEPRGEKGKERGRHRKLP